MVVIVIVIIIIVIIMVTVIVIKFLAACSFDNLCRGPGVFLDHQSDFRGRDLKLIFGEYSDSSNLRRLQTGSFKFYNDSFQDTAEPPLCKFILR